MVAYVWEVKNTTVRYFVAFVSTYSLIIWRNKIILHHQSLGDQLIASCGMSVSMSKSLNGEFTYSNNNIISYLALYPRQQAWNKSDNSL